jgi:hypothetical protein
MAAGSIPERTISMSLSFWLARMRASSDPAERAS